MSNEYKTDVDGVTFRAEYNAGNDILFGWYHNNTGDVIPALCVKNQIQVFGSKAVYYIMPREFTIRSDEDGRIEIYEQGTLSGHRIAPNTSIRVREVIKDDT